MIAIVDNYLSEKKGRPEVDVVETPFGRVYCRLEQVSERSIVFLARQPARPDPRAIACAARRLGATRVVGVVRDAAVERPVTPADFIEFTSGRPTTFFETIGAGYVQQDPPYCPELRGALLATRVAAGGVLLVVATHPTPVVRQWWAERGVHLISTESQPEGALCREMELCYTVLALPETRPIAPLLDGLVERLPAERGCACGQTLAVARQLGRLPEDWPNGCQSETRR
ncbi:MAG: hypothetical protein L0331_08515 [Chloroflexi bacterium]|nr:hypothetical protein [Chloroflexota bacterium]MCI0644562.1 hypothetical protein [Chloroflexota bacterium]